jgi:hypothetical protein
MVELSSLCFDNACFGVLEEVIGEEVPFLLLTEQERYR